MTDALSVLICADMDALFRTMCIPEPSLCPIGSLAPSWLGTKFSEAADEESVAGRCELGSWRSVQRKHHAK